MMNYFSPSFGNRPYNLIGRDPIIQTFLRGLESPPGSRERALLLLGQRGSGKTVLLLEFAEQARKKGFIVASPTVTSNGMLQRIVEKVQEEGESVLGRSTGRLTGGSLGALGFSVGLQFSKEEEEQKSFPYKLSRLSRALGETGHGIVILVDEVRANNPDLKELIIAYQELVGEGQDVVLVMAGLPGAISATLNDRVLTFLNRASKEWLLPLRTGEIDAYYRSAFAKMNLAASPEELLSAAESAKGSPYLMQLIGYYMTQYAEMETGSGEDCRFISGLTVEAAVKQALKDYKNDVCLTTLQALSDKDIRFLRAMLPDRDVSKMSDIATRLQVSPDYAQQYRRRLLDAGIVEQRQRGEIAFAVPYLQEFLREEE